MSAREACARTMGVGAVRALTPMDLRGRTSITPYELALLNGDAVREVRRVRYVVNGGDGPRPELVSLYCAPGDEDGVMARFGGFLRQAGWTASVEVESVPMRVQE